MNLLMNDLMMRGKVLFNRFLRNEEGDVNVVSIVVLIGVAVLLAVVFKDKAAGLIKTLFDTIGNCKYSRIIGNVFIYKRKSNITKYDKMYQRHLGLFKKSKLSTSANNAENLEGVVCIIDTLFFIHKLNIFIIILNLL